MHIETIPIHQINPAPYNPRKDLRPGDLEYQKLKQSITTFGYVEPLVWNKRSGVLVSGHQRLKVIIEQGVNEIEVSVVDLPLEKEKALNIALNKIEGSWDENKLALLLNELQEIPDFDVGLTGFDAPEISELLDNNSELQVDDNFDFESTLEAITIPITKPGDLIELGPHRLLCGNSSNLEDIKKLFGKTKVNLLHTDPPYNVNYYGGDHFKKNPRPKHHRLWERIYSDNLPQEEYEEWLRTIFSNIMSFLEKGAAFYIWNGHRQFGPMYLMLKELGCHISCVITWAKEHFVIGFGDYNQQTEFCLYGWKGNGTAHVWYGQNSETTLWQIKRDVTKNYVHPTQKPIALAQRAIINSSQRGDVIADLFLGSGSTLIAAESLQRSCFGIEIDPKYCDAIVRRYIGFMGMDNVLDSIKARYIQETAK